MGGSEWVPEAEEGAEKKRGLRGVRPVKLVRRDLGLVREIRSFIEEGEEDAATEKRTEEENEEGGLEGDGKAERKEDMDHLLSLLVAMTETDAIVVCVEQHQKSHSH